MKRTHRVLLVDDDESQLKLGKLLLREAGFDVETSSSAHEALNKARRCSPDGAIVSDVLMGDLDGFGLCRLIREESSLASVPVILVSAHYQGDTDQKFAARVGASSLIARTPDFEAELGALRHSLLARSTPAADAPDATLYQQHLRTNANQLTRIGQARHAEERYRTLFENANDTITVLTPDGMILEANERWRAVMGFPPHEMIGRHFGEFAPQERDREPR